MPKLDQKGLIPQILIFLLLAAGVGVGIYLVQNRTNLLPKAGGVRTQTPESSFTLEAPKTVSPNSQFKVNVMVRSDIDAANLFSVKLKFQTDLLEVKKITTNDYKIGIDIEPKLESCGGIAGKECPEGFSCLMKAKYPDAEGQCVKAEVVKDAEKWLPSSSPQIDKSVKGVSTIKEEDITASLQKGNDSKPQTGYSGKNSFIKSWIEKTFDNKEGKISLVGAVPDPGYQTKLENPAVTMATIVFTARKEGSAAISFDEGTAIYKNSDNLDILATKREAEIKISNDVPQGTPVPPGPVPTCEPRPACLDSEPRCLMSEPATGWCPTASIQPIPTCQPRPACLDTQPACMIAEPATGWCDVVIQPVPTKADGDVNGDGKITLVDLSSLLSKWGKKGKDAGKADINGDGVVNNMDRSMLIGILIENGVLQRNAPEVKAVPEGT